MTVDYDLNVSGSKAQTVVNTPVNGKNGEPLGPAGNGKDGQADLWHKCVQPAGPGQPGNAGFGAPPADGGANGGNAVSVTITCSEYSGDPVSLLNMGGDGATGNTGGVGGSGSSGGNAGKQPKGCNDVISGGIGGAAGSGGNAGAGGKAGNAGDVVVVYGSGFSQVPISAQSGGGQVGMFGQPGQAGTPGTGGLNSDGTSALSGSAAGGGGSGKAGDGGYGGSFKATTDPNKPPRYLMISVQTHVGT
jgi:hypothetical protein